MNNQEAFNKVRAHLLKQMEKSKAMVGNWCLYRGPGGLKCAIGALIPDDQYALEMEDVSLDKVLGLVPSLHTLSFDLMRDLQMVHDYQPPENWEEDLDIVAKFYGLKVQP